MLFLARSSSQPEELMAGEYLFVQPEDLAWTLSRAEDAELRQGCLREVERKLRDDPGTQRALELRDKLLEL